MSSPENARIADAQRRALFAAEVSKPVAYTITKREGLQ